MSVSVNGSLTYDQLLKIRNDNVGYESDPTFAKVNLYIQATDAMLGTPLTDTEHAGEAFRQDPTELRLGLEVARRWKAAATMASRPLPVFQPACGWRDE
jgi:hypothetical protein